MLLRDQQTFSKFHDFLYFVSKDLICITIKYGLNSTSNFSIIVAVII